MEQSSPLTNKELGIKPPRVDHLLLDEERDVTPRPRNDLLTGIMQQYDCGRPQAERILDDKGTETIERELQEKGLNSTRWGGIQ